MSAFGRKSPRNMKDELSFQERTRMWCSHSFPVRHLQGASVTMATCSKLGLQRMPTYL